MNDPYPIYSIGETESIVKYTLFGVAALAALLYCLRLSRTLGQKWPLYGFAGSALLVSYEPFNNLLAQCAYPTSGDTLDPMLTWFDQTVPWSTWLIYMFYFSFAVPQLVQRLDRGMTTRQFMAFYGITAAICAAFEPLFCHPDIGINWWYYYGEGQALDFTGMPLFWVFANSMVVVAMGTIFHLLKKHVFRTDRETIAFIPLSPLILFGVHGSASIPVFVAVSEGANEFWSTVATLSTIAVSFFYLWILSRAACVSGPGSAPEAEECELDQPEAPALAGISR